MADFSISADGSAMFSLSGQLDTATVPLMELAIEDAVARGGPITLDMVDVTFIGSSGIGAILRTVASLPTGCMILHGVHAGVGKELDLTNEALTILNLHVIPCLEGSDPAKRAAPSEEVSDPLTVI